MTPVRPWAPVVVRLLLQAVDGGVAAVGDQLGEVVDLAAGERLQAAGDAARRSRANRRCCRRRCCPAPSPSGPGSRSRCPKDRKSACSSPFEAQQSLSSHSFELRRDFARAIAAHAPVDYRAQDRSTRPSNLPLENNRHATPLHFGNSAARSAASLACWMIGTTTAANPKEPSIGAWCISNLTIILRRRSAK